MSGLTHVVPAGPEESAHFLTGLGQAKGLDLGALLGPLLAGGKVDFGALLKSPAFIAAILPLLIGLIKNASGGGAGVPGELPTVPPPKPPKPTVPDTTAPVDDADDTPVSGERTFAGLKGHYGNFQSGPAGSVRPDEGRGNEVFDRGANIFGPEKTKFIAYLTPVMSDGQGLRLGDDENDDIEVDYYGLEFDGREYIGDAMKDLGPLGIRMSNFHSSAGMNPRVVIDGMSGDHTFAVIASSNGHRWKGETLNVKGLA